MILVSCALGVWRPTHLENREERGSCQRALVQTALESYARWTEVPFFHTEAASGGQVSRPAHFKELRTG